MTLKMPSSVSVGSRSPRSCLIFSYSSGVRPCCRRISGVGAEVKAVGMRNFYCRILGRGWVGKAGREIVRSNQKPLTAKFATGELVWSPGRPRSGCSDDAAGLRPGRTDEASVAPRVHVMSQTSGHNFVLAFHQATGIVLCGDVAEA